MVVGKGWHRGRSQKVASHFIHTQEADRQEVGWGYKSTEATPSVMDFLQQSFLLKVS